MTVALVFLVLFTAVGPMLRVAAPQSPKVAASRHWPQTHWVLRGRLTAGVTPEFRIPVALGVEDSTIFTVDGQDGLLRAYSLRGKLMWSRASADESLAIGTSGPLVVAPDGRVWTIDRRIWRAVSVKPASPETASLPVGHPFLSVAPLATNRFLVIDLGDSVSVVDAGGRRLRLLAIPDAIRNATPLARESFASVSPNGTAVIAFRWSGDLLLLGPAEQAFRAIEPIERRPYPAAITTVVTTPHGKVPITRIDPRAEETIVAVAVDDARVYVVMADSSGTHDGSTLDTYDAVTQQYLASYRLPNRISELAVRGQTLYALTFAPGANIMEWTLPSEPRLSRR